MTSGEPFSDLSPVRRPRRMALASGPRLFRGRAGRQTRSWLHDTIDVTEQKELEEALRKSVEELQQLKAKLQAENLFLRQEAGLETATPKSLVGAPPWAACWNRWTWSPPPRRPC